MTSRYQLTPIMLTLLGKSGGRALVKALIFILALSAVLLFRPKSDLHAQEFVIFTKTQDQRSAACSSAAAPQCERFNSSQLACGLANTFSCRGFDPTRNISSGLTTPVNCPDIQTNCPSPPDGALELFIRLGPGEATGNMHGRIQGANGSLCKELYSTEPGSQLCSGVGNLNLGIEKYNPKTQGDNAPCVGIVNPGGSLGTPNPSEGCDNPTGNGIDTAGDATSGFSEQFLRNDDFFPGAVEHVGFKFSVAFKWMDESNPSNCNSNRTGMTQFVSNCTYSTQSVQQVTGLDATLGIGTRAVPGPGDQVAQMDILGWSSQNKGASLTSDDIYTTPGSAAVQATGLNPRISWHQTFSDPNFSGLSGFTSDQSGDFTYCHGAHNASGDPCFSVVLPDAIYPTGTSQTLGDFKSCLHYDPSTGTTGGACP